MLQPIPIVQAYINALDLRDKPVGIVEDGPPECSYKRIQVGDGSPFNNSTRKEVQEYAASANEWLHEQLWPKVIELDDTL